MRYFSWDEYYEKYYDWAKSKRIKNLSYLSSLGSSDEVAEIILDLSFDKEKAANRLLKRAVEEKIKFSAEDLVNFSLFADEKILNEAVLISSSKINPEDMDELSQILDDEVVLEICKSRKFPLPEGFEYLNEDDEEDWEDAEEFSDDFPQDDLEFKEPHKRAGFFSSLMLAIGAISIYDHIKEKYFEDNGEK